MELKIKEEFKKLIPPLTAEEFKQLETNCIDEGIRDAIVTWQGFIIDGHNRYKIATDWQLSFKTIEKAFESEYDVIEWMLVNQLGRRNLNDTQKSKLRGDRYENEKLRSGFRTDLNPKWEKVNTAQKLAEEYNVSKNTILRDNEFSRGVDLISKVAPEKHDEILLEKTELTKQEIQDFSKIEKVVEKQIKSEQIFISEDELKAKVEAKAKELASIKLKDLKEQKAAEYKEKLNQRIEHKTQTQPISLDEQKMLNQIANGETVVINMNTHFHVLKYAKDKGIYKQIDRYSEFGNPFFLDSDGNREQVCDGYIEYFKHKRSLHNKVNDLKGKVLGCHCAPLRCHGDYLKQLADENN
jgi:hypothetical protein